MRIKSQPLHGHIRTQKANLQNIKSRKFLDLMQQDNVNNIQLIELTFPWKRSRSSVTNNSWISWSGYNSVQLCIWTTNSQVNKKNIRKHPLILRLEKISESRRLEIIEAEAYRDKIILTKECDIMTEKASSVFLVWAQPAWGKHLIIIAYLKLLP